MLSAQWLNTAPSGLLQVPQPFLKPRKTTWNCLMGNGASIADCNVWNFPRPHLEISGRSRVSPERVHLISLSQSNGFTRMLNIWDLCPTQTLEDYVWVRVLMFCPSATGQQTRTEDTDGDRRSLMFTVTLHYEYLSLFVRCFFPGIRDTKGALEAPTISM